MPMLGPDGLPGVWRTRGGEVVFVPFDAWDQSGPASPAVLGIALSDARGGESVWISTERIGGFGAKILMRAEEQVVAGEPVALAGPTAVRPARSEETGMVSSWTTMASTPVMGFSPDTRVSSEESLRSVGVSGMLPLRRSTPAWPRGWGALVARVGKEGAGDLERGEPFTVASRRWPGILFGVKKDGSVAAVRVVREDGQPADLAEVAEVPAPTYPGNGGPPPWPEVVLGRLVALEADETLLFGTGELGGVSPVTRRMRLGEA